MGRLAEDRETVDCLKMRVSFQYSLRGLFVAVTVFLVFLGAQANRAHRQREALAEVEDVTRDVEYDYQRATEEASIDYSRAPHGWPWLRDLLGSDYFDTVVGISLEGTERPISDRDIACLSQFPHLRYAVINGASSITPRGCSSFASISQQTKELYLDNVHGEALIGIAKLTKLRVLWFTRAATTDEAISSLANARHLRELVLSGSSVSDDAVPTLVGLNNLNRLDLEGTRITDGALSQLANMRSLESLNLAKTKITDKGLTHLAQMPLLKYLDLTETAITDTGVLSLAALRNLKAISVARTGITVGGVDTLRRALPDCRVDSSRASPEGEDF